MRGLLGVLSGRLLRRTLLSVLLPAIFVCCFGGLAGAAALFPAHFSWRSLTISKLLDPPNGPWGRGIASAAIAAGGFLMLPFAGYIGRRLGRGAHPGCRVGAILFGAGAIGLGVSGLLAYRADSLLPGLHTGLARASACLLSAGILFFWAYAIADFLRPSAGARRLHTGLVLGWTLVVLSGPASAALSWIGSEARTRADPGLWEWVAAGVLYIFLVLAAALLPGEDAERRRMPRR